MIRSPALAVLVILNSCTAGPPASESQRKVPNPADSFHLVVSNQSFQKPQVGIQVTIDGHKVVDQPFDVEGQHNFVPFSWDLAAGRHTLAARADDGTPYSTTVLIPAGEPRYGVLLYWADPETDPHFTFELRDSPPSFG